MEYEVMQVTAEGQLTISASYKKKAKWLKHRGLENNGGLNSSSLIWLLRKPSNLISLKSGWLAT